MWPNIRLYAYCLSEKLCLHKISPSSLFRHYMVTASGTLVVVVIVTDSSNSNEYKCVTWSSCDMHTTTNMECWSFPLLHASLSFSPSLHSHPHITSLHSLPFPSSSLIPPFPFLFHPPLGLISLPSSSLLPLSGTRSTHARTGAHSRTTIHTHTTATHDYISVARQYTELGTSVSVH